MDAAVHAVADAFLEPKDAPLPDAVIVEPDAVLVGDDAYTAPPDARVPDAHGACMPGATTPCTSACGTTGVSRCMGTGFGPCEPPPERCNGLDDDCNGLRDDTFACALGAVSACTTSCGSTGSRSCTGTCAWSTCSPPATESCNGVDDTCDGTVDEGFRARYAFSTYTALSALQPGCNGTSQRIGADCNAAIHRLCRDGCTTSGFGPVENSGDVANVACVIGEVRAVSFATLAASHPVCNGTSERVGPSCNAAAHRWCVAQGFPSGFGPVEIDGTNTSVTCVRNAVVHETTYATLSTHLAPCNGTGERWGTGCNAAIGRYCTSLGFATGYGPVENDGVRAFVTCLRP